MRIAMWSGPRNLSTAMMYSFGARSDSAIWDEPFYAAYLSKTGLNHPMRAEILAAGETDPQKVAARCAGSAPYGKPVFYQKLMTHHMLPEFPKNWMEGMSHVFLIRNPARVIASYNAKRENPTLEDIGFRQQADIFNHLKGKGLSPVVIDSDDILQAPETMLKKLCCAINLPYEANMLSWPKGGHKDDGAWGPHWYGSVWQSTGFASDAQKPAILSAEGERLCQSATPYFEMLSEHKL